MAISGTTAIVGADGHAEECRPRIPVRCLRVLSWQFRDYAFDKGIELRSSLGFGPRLANGTAGHRSGGPSLRLCRHGQGTLTGEVEPIKVQQEAAPCIVDLRRSGGSASCAST